MTGVMPLPAASSRKSPSSAAGVNVPAGGRMSSTLPARHVVGDPVRRVPVGHPLDGDRRPVARVRRAGQRVAAGHRAVPVMRDADGQELARAVAERRVQLRRDVQHERARLVGLADHLGHPQLVGGAGRGHRGLKARTPPGGPGPPRGRCWPAGWRSRRSGPSAPRRPSARRTRRRPRTACGLHCTLVCCGLNLAASTAAPQRSHPTSRSSAFRSSARGDGCWPFAPWPGACPPPMVSGPRRAARRGCPPPPPPTRIPRGWCRSRTHTARPCPG